MKHIIGAVTLGQSPRDDVVPGIRRTLGEGFEVLECGALDGLRSEEIARFPPRSGDYVLVTKGRKNGKGFPRHDHSEASTMHRQTGSGRRQDHHPPMHRRV